MQAPIAEAPTLARQLDQPLLTISATRAFAAKWLLPRLPDFRSTHPEIDLQLHAADEADLRSVAVDIAIRYGRGAYPALIAEPSFTGRFAPMANPTLLSRAQATWRACR